MAEGIIMVQSINTKVDLVIEGTSHMGLTDYGKIMIGDKGFEFFNDRDVRKNIQIPWIASVMFKGRWIPRYGFQTKKNGTFTFSSKQPRKVLRAVREYIEPDRMVRSLTFFQVVKRALKNRFSSDGR